jgi:glutamine amidotransferase
MCRLLGYIGSPVPISGLVYDPPHSLRVQSYAPRLQDVGRINADGWGVGWYDPTVDDRPARYRTPTPMWADERFAGIARFLCASHVIAAVRNASPGLPVEESGTSPFVADQWLFTHNGFVRRWHEGVGIELRRRLSDRREMQVAGRSDSEVVFATILDHLDRGETVDDALRIVMAQLHELAECRLNFLLSDGTTMWGTRDANTLYLLETEVGRTLASEPYDDDPRWNEVPERSLVHLDADGVTVEAL